MERVVADLLSSLSIGRGIAGSVFSLAMETEVGSLFSLAMVERPVLALPMEEELCGSIEREK
jgi:hypothetical protein